jgi:hypothetical protein
MVFRTASDCVQAGKKTKIEYRAAGALAGLIWYGFSAYVLYSGGFFAH